MVEVNFSYFNSSKIINIYGCNKNCSFLMTSAHFHSHPIFFSLCFLSFFILFWVLLSPHSSFLWVPCVLVFILLRVTPVSRLILDSASPLLPFPILLFLLSPSLLLLKILAPLLFLQFSESWFVPVQMLLSSINSLVPKFLLPLTSSYLSLAHYVPSTLVLFSPVPPVPSHPLIPAFSSSCP